MSARIACRALLGKVCAADTAAGLIEPGSTVGMSGFTAAGYPKAVPLALAERIRAEHAAGRAFSLRLFTGASTGPELDGALADVDGVEFRLPYNSDPIAREKINRGAMEYFDMHLSQVAPVVRQGFLGKLDVAVIEATGIRVDGSLIPSTSLGTNKTWLEESTRVIVEVNHWQDPALEGIHDIYYGLQSPPRSTPIPLERPGQRIGEPYLRCDPRKIIAVVETNAPDRNREFTEPGAAALAIAGHLLDFFAHEVTHGRLPKELLPLQSGVGNVANAVLGGLLQGPFEQMSAYTEVLQDSMLELLRADKLQIASATAFCLSPAAVRHLRTEMPSLHPRIILRQQEVSNHPEVIRRLGCLAMNGMIECDLFGNVNSTHVMGSRIQNGIGGSGDFARNAYLSIFMAPSIAKGGAISTVVPRVSHVDHVTQDVQILVTEQGLADLRGLSPKQRARTILRHCVHPQYRAMLEDYYARALQGSYGLQSPMLLGEALSWHQRYLDTGSMCLR